MTTPPPLVIKVPPAPPKKSSVNPVDKWLAAHKGMAQYKVPLEQWAGTYGVPVLWLASVIWKESRGQNVPWNPKVKGAGVAQINIQSPPGTLQQFRLQQQGAPTVQQIASDPNLSIAFLAYTMASSGAATVDDFYTHTWNPGAKPAKGNPLPSGFLKGYTVSVTGHTPPQKAAGAAATAAAKASTPGDQLATTKRSLDPVYLAYTGRPATMAEVQAYLKNPTSTYQIELQLADPKNNKQIYRSPVWQTNAPRYEQYYRDVFGPNAKVPQNAVLYGIVHSLDETAFKGMMAHGQLPGQKPYMQSEEYKGLAAQYRSQFAQIYGTPGSGGEQLIHDAVMNGWTADQWNQYLRSRPEYTSSDEYKQRAISLARSMGLLQGTGGAQTVLGSGSAVADEQGAQAAGMNGPVFTAAQAGAVTPVNRAAQGVGAAAAAVGAQAEAGAARAGKKVGNAAKTVTGAIGF